MGNTTDIIITCFGEDEVIAGISEKTGINFLKVSDGEKAGGSKILCFESYGACYRSLGKEKIAEVIQAFHDAKFSFPETASLIISDDDDVFTGTVIREP